MWTNVWSPRWYSVSTLQISTLGNIPIKQRNPVSIASLSLADALVTQQEKIIHWVLIGPYLHSHYRASSLTWRAIQRFKSVLPETHPCQSALPNLIECQPHVLIATSTSDYMSHSLLSPTQQSTQTLQWAASLIYHWAGSTNSRRRLPIDSYNFIWKIRSLLAARRLNRQQLVWAMALPDTYLL